MNWDLVRDYLGNICINLIGKLGKFNYGSDSGDGDERINFSSI